MSQVDLDDLPPRIARELAALSAGEELALVQKGVVVARLVVAEQTAPDPATPVAGLSPEEEVAEVLDHFGSIINDEF